MSKLRIQDATGQDVVVMDLGSGGLEILSPGGLGDAARAWWDAVATMRRIHPTARDIVLREGEGKNGGDLVFTPGSGWKQAKGGDITLFLAEDPSVVAAPRPKVESEPSRVKRCGKTVEIAPGVKLQCVRDKGHLFEHHGWECPRGHGCTDRACLDGGCKLNRGGGLSQEDFARLVARVLNEDLTDEPDVLCFAPELLGSNSGGASLKGTK